MHEEVEAPIDRATEIRALAESMPRPLIAEGLAEELASWWVTSRAGASERGGPAFARHALTKDVRGVLFEALRARWLRRGLEEAGKTLLAQQRGLAQTPSARVASGRRRISRLLVVSADGSARFYREVEKLCRRYDERLDALVLECDEVELGEAIFGAGKSARAVLLDHKEAVLQLMLVLEPESAG